MNLHTLGLALATATAVAVFSACSPLADDTSAPAAEGAPVPQATAPAERGTGPAVVMENRRPKAAGSAPADGQFKYINERGQVQVAARLEDIPESQRSTASVFRSTPIPARPELPADDIRPASNADVTIYSTSSCPYCRAAIAYFEKHGIPYENRDVQADREANTEYLEITGGRRGVPVIVVGEKWMQGWNQQGFDDLLASAR